MGSIYGAMFADAGNDVWFVDASQPIVDAINKSGAVITQPDGSERIYRIPATSKPDTLGQTVDAVLFQVKGFATATAAKLVRPLTTPGTIIVTLQNGLGNEDVLRAAYPENPIVLGISVHSAAMIGPGRYHLTGVRATWLGPADPRWQSQAERVASALSASAYPVHVEDEHAIRREIFAKWVLNCGSLPTMALTCLPTTAVATNDLVLAHIDALTREACALAAAEGYPLDAEERVAYNRDLFRTAGGKASMLQDIEAGRRTEIETISGAAVRLADKHNHAAPLSRAMFALVKGRETAMAFAK